MKRTEQSEVVYKTIRYLCMLGVQALLVCVWLLLIPKEACNALWLGYSLNRLMLLSFILAGSLLAFTSACMLKKCVNWQDSLISTERRMHLARLALPVSFMLAALGWSALFMPLFLHLFHDLAFYMRLLPLLCLLSLAGWESLLFILLVWLKKKTEISREKSKRLQALIGKPFTIVLGLLLFTWLAVEVTGIGKSPEQISINSLGVPLLEGQVWFGIGWLLLFMLLDEGWRRLPASDSAFWKKHPDLWISLGLWLLAVGIWMSQPLPVHNYFSTQYLPPNFVNYPFSDAEQYDTNALWVWQGSIRNIVVSKPLYVSFLALLHALVGLSYAHMILVQTLVLALLPVVLYLIGKELHSRLGGLALALFAILRELNSIQAVNIANVSNSKLLLSDLPATLLVALLILVLVRWYKSRPERVSLQPFLIGGILACLSLMRIQTMLLLPFAFLAVLLRYWKNARRVLLASGLCLLAMALVLMPVLARNHAITGTYWLDNPSTSSALYRFFIDENDYDFEIPEAESGQEMIERNLNVIAQVLRSDLAGLTYSITDNFIHNILSTFLVLPVRLGNETPLLELIQIPEKEPFWEQVYSQANLINALSVLLHLTLIALGAAHLLRQSRNVFWVLMSFYALYNLSSALVRLSGWRFIMPVDWLALSFFVFGLLDFFYWLRQHTFREDMVKHEMTEPHFVQQPWLRQYGTGLAAFAVIFAGCGAFIPLRESLFPSFYPKASKDQVCTVIQNALFGTDWEGERESITSFCLDKETEAIMGVGVYPRFFEAGSGFYDRPDDYYFGEQDYGRLVFRTIGVPNGKVFIKTENPQIHFKDGDLTYVVGRSHGTFEACIVYIQGEIPELLVSECYLD